MKNSKIEWTDHTFNPWWGCTEVPGHPGCAHCYAKLFAARTGRAKWGKGEKRVLMSESYWKEPHKWNEEAKRDGVRRRVFCASMADVFDAEVADTWRGALFDTITTTPNLDWLLLTKRPDQAARFYDEYIFTHSDGRKMPIHLRDSHAKEFLPNVWIGVSVSDQKTADQYIPKLLEIPAVCRFISYEPALGPVDFCGWIPKPKDWKWFPIECRHGYDACPKCDHNPKPEDAINWIIVGGESGPKARPFNVEWARSTVAQCQAAGVACFVKQLGAVPMMPEAAWRSLPLTPVLSAKNKDRVPTDMVPLLISDPKAGDISEWTSIATRDLAVREFPSHA